jgi:asparagine synthase (glutamine-hydrolysing)
MCGIAGFVTAEGERAQAEDVRRMCQSIVHRGPDEEGIYARGRVGLGIRRLSIIDLSGGQQPIHDESQTIWVVFNGEIYNFIELRNELEQRGHRFYTHADTEVIVHLYEEFGADCVKKLRGMFGIALYDERKQYLLLARDRLGKKPLHYAVDGERFYFGSEIKTILAIAPHLAEVDPEGLLQFFYFDYIPDPLTAFRRIKKLPPGHLLEYSRGNVTVRQYWDLPEYGSHSPATEQECLDELERRLAEAVRIRLISDVPLGALLSGGVDSSVIVALMARASSSKVKTFSIGFENEDYNELEYARIVTKHFGTDHHEMVVKPDIAGTLEKLTYMMEEPFGDSSMIPTYYVSAMARQHVTVALAGDGGDELFAGYDRYVVNLQRQRYDSIPEWMGELYRSHVYHRLPNSFKGRKLSWNISLRSRDRYLDGVSFLPACHRERELFSKEFLEVASKLPDPLQHFRNYYDNGPAKDPLSRLLYLDTKTYMTADVLAKVDRMSMANSLEVRVPLLDHEFVEWVTRLPAKWKYRDGTRKYILKKLAERIGVPAALLHRRKQGFALPLVHWMRHEMKDSLRDILLDDRTLQRGYFNPNSVRALVEEHLSGRRDRSGLLWQLLVFELWHRNFLKRLPGQVAEQGLDTCGRPAADQPRHEEYVPLIAQKIAPDDPPFPHIKAAMRVTIVGPSLRKVGGQAVQAELLTRNWRNESRVVTRFVPIDPVFPSGLMWAERVPFLRTVLRAPIFWTQLWKGIGDADVVHIFSASYSSFWITPVPAWIVARLRGKKTLVNYRSGEARDHMSKSALARAMLRRMGAKVVPSGYLRDVFRELGMVCDVIPNLVDTDHIKYHERSQLKPVLICTRSCEPYYAVDDVVRAFGLVQQLYPEARLLLLGGGSREQDVRALARELHLANVEFVGKVAREQMGGHYDRADIFINASVLDNMPVSLLEAFAAGTPIVSTTAGGIPYIVEHERTGLLSKPHDWQALADNVIRLLRKPELAAALARNAYEQSREYRWEAARERWLEVYESTARPQSESKIIAAPGELMTPEAK